MPVHNAPSGWLAFVSYAVTAGADEKVGIKISVKWRSLTLAPETPGLLTTTESNYLGRE